MLSAEPETVQKTTFAQSHGTLRWRCDNAACAHMWEAIPNIVLREGDDQTDCPFCSNPPKQLCSSDDACARCISKTIAGSANAHLFAGTLAEAQKVFAQTRTKVQWKCDEPSCRKTWWATGGNVNSANDTGCPHCNKSYAQKNGEAFFTAEGVRRRSLGCGTNQFT